MLELTTDEILIVLIAVEARVREKEHHVTRKKGNKEALNRDIGIFNAINAHYYALIGPVNIHNPRQTYKFPMIDLVR